MKCHRIKKKYLILIAFLIILTTILLYLRYADLPYETHLDGSVLSSLEVGMKYEDAIDVLRRAGINRFEESRFASKYIYYAEVDTRHTIGIYAWPHTSEVYYINYIIKGDEDRFVDLDEFLRSITSEQIN